MSIVYKIIDHTYYRLKRRIRKCASCGERRNYKGKVNFGILFDRNPKKLYYHESCLKNHLRGLKGYDARIL